MSEENKKATIAYFQKLINDFDPATAIVIYGGKIISNTTR